MDDHEIKAAFEAANAIITGSHFVYKSGRHADVYVNKDAVWADPILTSSLAREMALPFLCDGVRVVAGPAIGGAILAQWVAYHLAEATREAVHAIFSEKDGAAFVIKRGYDKIVAGKRVLVVEDVLTTGGSAKLTVETVRAADGEVVGVSALCNRSAVTIADVGNVPKLHTQINISLQTWSEEECPLCKAGVPINMELGHGREFLARKK